MANGSADEFWRVVLNSAKYVVAPMVDQSELAWRILCRRHGAQLCYSPMFHAAVFTKDSNYRQDALASCPEDRPLIIQFCANDPKILLKAAKMAESHCEAIDLNLGCPQAIAKRGHYGAYLQEEWELLAEIVKVCSKELKVPITCKIRVFEDIDKTVRYAKMLERAGCKLLTVHGRTREQKGAHTGIASWKHIKAVRRAIRIPMFANGNIQYLPDIDRCIKETGVQGVMTAEGNLRNPALFEGIQPLVWEMSEEYLELVSQYTCPTSYIRGHLFKICHHALLVHNAVRDDLARARDLSDFNAVVARLKVACANDVEEYKTNPSKFTQKLLHPYWLCQPYVRPSPIDEFTKKRVRDHPPFVAETAPVPDVSLSKNQQKKLKRNPKKKFTTKVEQYEKCECGNPRGLNCTYDLCRSCCWQNAKLKIYDCLGHKILVKTKHLNKQDKLKEANDAETRVDVVEHNRKDCDIADDDVKKT